MRELVKKWASRNKVIPHDWFQLVSAILDHGPQLQWKEDFFGEKKLRPFNIKVESEVLRSPKIIFLVRALILIQIGKIYTMNTCCPYAIQQS